MIVGCKTCTCGECAPPVQAAPVPSRSDELQEALSSLVALVNRNCAWLSGPDQATLWRARWLSRQS